MGFLHKLWDETLAGPAPDSGLGKLRKYDSFGASPTSISSSSSSSLLSNVVVPHEEMAISRSITIIRTKNLSVDPASPSSASPSTPTPLSPVTPRGEFKRLARRKSTAEPTSPTVYDWVVMSALDR